MQKKIDGRPSLLIYSNQNYKTNLLTSRGTPLKSHFQQRNCILEGILYRDGSKDKKKVETIIHNVLRRKAFGAITFASRGSEEHRHLILCGKR